MKARRSLEAHGRGWLGLEPPIRTSAAVIALLLAPSARGDVGAGRVDRNVTERGGWTLVPSDRLVDVVVPGPPPDARFREIAPGHAIGRIRANEVDRRAGRELPGLEILPELRLASDRAGPIIGVPEIAARGLTGRGVLAGVIDSGFDVQHPALRRLDGSTRMEWLLDFTRRARGKHPELEAKFGLPGCFAQADDGKALDGGSCDPGPGCGGVLPCSATLGAIYAATEIDGLLAALPTAPEPPPTDEEGHGTHAMGIVAGTRRPGVPYAGVAPEAGLVGVKVDGEGLSVNPTAVLKGVEFVFDRADAAKAPAVVNLSLTADFVARDAADGFTSTLVAMTRRPGRVIVAAAGNSGDPVIGSHQTANVERSTPVRVPFRVSRAPSSAVGIIVSPHPGASVRVGCDAPESRWVLPVDRGRTRSATLGGDKVANVVFDPNDFRGQLPASSQSALVLLNGALAPEATRTYWVVLEGAGTVDLWIRGAAFDHGVREQTVGSPANHPEIIAVGASVAREGYRTKGGEELHIRAQLYDEPGLLPLPVSAPPLPGQVAAFSGAGPGATGAVKPDLLAPGVMILSAASTQRELGQSLFLGSARCPVRADESTTSDPECLLVDAEHGASSGTSFAAPFVSGAAAILLEAEPTLTQEEARTALQAGVHPSRTRQRFLESGSVGELDVPGALDVARRLRAPVSLAPSPLRSWMTPNSHYAPADGTRPLEVLYHLRSEDGLPADGFDRDRFGASFECGGVTSRPSRLTRVGPGMWSASFVVPSDRVGQTLVLRASFDGVEIAPSVAIPIALDPWQARYPPSASGASCSAAPASTPAGPRAALAFVGLALLAFNSRRRSRSGCRGTPMCSCSRPAPRR